MVLTRCEDEVLTLEEDRQTPVSGVLIEDILARRIELWIKYT